MRVDKKNVFTPGIVKNSNEKKETRLTKMFALNAPFSGEARSLQGRVSIPKQVTPRGKRVTAFFNALFSSKRGTR